MVDRQQHENYSKQENKESEEDAHTNYERNQAAVEWKRCNAIRRKNSDPKLSEVSSVKKDQFGSSIVPRQVELPQ